VPQKISKIDSGKPMFSADKYIRMKKTQKIFENLLKNLRKSVIM